MEKVLETNPPKQHLAANHKQNKNQQITILKKQDYSIQFDGAEVIEGNEEKDIVFDYKLSKNELMVMEESDDPKLDHFLNQILR